MGGYLQSRTTAPLARFGIWWCHTRAERREAEGQGQVVQLNIERETTRRELERLQEDLAVIMGRLSLGKREKG